MLYWTRKGDDGKWKLCPAIDSKRGIDLPANGIKLFSATPQEKDLATAFSLSTPLTTLQGDFTLVATWADSDRYVPARLTVTTDDRLAATLLTPLQTDYPLTLPDTAHRAALTLHTPVGGPVASPQALDLRIAHCQQIRYLTEQGHKVLTGFSYPFGLAPYVGQTFDLLLPVAMLHAGGELTIKPRWHALPDENFSSWYKNYTSAPASNCAFKVQFSLITPQGAQPLAGAHPLFDGNGRPIGLPLSVMLAPNANLTADANVTLRVTLVGQDFLHSEWQRDPSGKNPPWTPQISRMDICFQQRLSLAPVTELAADTSDDDRQHLLLGFSGVKPQESVSVYWSLRAASDLKLSWHYVSGHDERKPLDAYIQDDTQAFTMSNLWRVTLPADIQAQTLPYAGLESDAYAWMIASVPATQPIAAEDAPTLYGVMANAMRATLNTRTPVDDSHFAQPLPANTISQLAEPIAGISGVKQPFPSTGGRAEETTSAMMQRAAKRIAHRQRAITWKNMRDLLLDRYPQLYDVRFPGVDKLSHLPALTSQILMVIPDSRYSDSDDAFEPTLNKGLLTTMAQWLQQQTSLWAKPELTNPIYTKIAARYQLNFQAGINPGYGYRQLAQQLQQEYMPWGSDKQQSVTPGNQIDYYQLFARLQQSPLVKHVVSLLLLDGNQQERRETLTAKENEVLILCPDSGEEYV